MIMQTLARVFVCVSPLLPSVVLLPRVTPASLARFLADWRPVKEPCGGQTWAKGDDDADLLVVSTHSLTFALASTLLFLLPCARCVTAMD